MGCENGNFDNNTECVSKTPIRSAEDFTASVNKCANDAIKCRELGKMGKIPEDELPSLDFTSQAGPQLGNGYNRNASTNVKLPGNQNNRPQNGINVGPGVTTGNINQNNPSGTINIGVQR